MASPVPNHHKGRPKGARTKVHIDLKRHVLYVMEQLEKQGLGLLDWAKANPNDFYKCIVSKILPRTIEGKLDGDFNIKVVTGIERSPNDD